jgi:hypothetical protein
MTMKKLFAGASLAFVLCASAGIVSAADLANLSGQSCGTLTGTWHFVNNQIPAGSPVGTLYATWNSGSIQCTTTASAVNKNTQHFYCTAAGTLDGASTNLGGRLLLSDFTCESVPKCDPKTDPTCK